jgi:RIO-like serine/threonine protein kinase
MPLANPESDDLDALFEDFRPAEWPLVADSNQGTLVRVQTGHLDLAVKTPRGRGIAWRARRFSLRREYRAYRRIADIPGFPRCLGLFGGCHLALEYVDGALLRHAVPADPERFFDRLRDAITAMHARGVAHGDLKSRQNVMVTGDGQPMIIDLGTAVVRKPGWHPLNRRLFEYLRQIDLNGWVKLKYGSYDRVDELDRHMVRRSRIERVNNWARRRGL